MNYLKDFRRFYSGQGTKIRTIINADPPQNVTVSCNEYRSNICEFILLVTKLQKEYKYLNSFWGKVFGSNYRRFIVDKELEILSSMPIFFSWSD